MLPELQKIDTGTEPVISVGIMAAPELRVTLHGHFTAQDGTMVTGDILLTACQGGESPCVVFQGRSYDSIKLTPECSENCAFELHDVTIGVGFHWERRESQRFRGVLGIYPAGGDTTNLQVINFIHLEEYLKSVISSEMSAHASPSLLKAHAVVSRSWLLRQLLDQGKHTSAEAGGWKRTTLPDGRQVDELVKWYDREDHTMFHVCADDHCQRYQGITRATSFTVEQAVNETAGEVLTYDGEVCDARFSKCCGGVTEHFENCWENSPKPYLTHIADTPPGNDTPFCDTSDVSIITQVLNNYDRETIDFYRWEVRYTPDELSKLLLRRSGIDFGEIKSLVPLSRTQSGRITRLLIEGSARSAIVGKELEIRRWLSDSHLRSSAFDITRTPSGEFLLNGRGWGHGVGMCQIGAAVMGAKGYSYHDILNHYFPAAQLTRLY